MAKMSTDDLLEAFKEMTLLELSDFVKQFEETFDVKAAAPVAVAAPTAGGTAGGQARPAAEPDEIDVHPEGDRDTALAPPRRASHDGRGPPGRQPSPGRNIVLPHRVVHYT